MGNHLHERRKFWVKTLANDIGRDQLAARLGYTDTNYLNQVITGHSPLGNTNARRWAEKLGLPADYLDQPTTTDGGGSPSSGSVAGGQIDSVFEQLTPSEAVDVIRDLMDELEPDQRIQIAKLALAGLPGGLQPSDT